MKAKERHEIKTDRFLDIMVKIEEIIVRHAKLLGWTILAVVIILVAWFGMTTLISSREESASDALNPLIAEITAIQGEPEIDQASAEKLETKLKTVLENNGGTAAAITAKYYLASLYTLEGKIDDAETLLKQVVDSRHPTMWQAASSDLGSLLQSQGKFKEAASVYSAVVDSDSVNVPTSFFAWRAGQCYERLGDSKSALSYYNKAKNSQDLPLDSLLARKIESKIQDFTKE